MKFWQRASPIRLKHEATGQYLHHGNQNSVRHISLFEEDIHSHWYAHIC